MGGRRSPPGSGCTQQAVGLALGDLYESTCKKLQPQHHQPNPVLSWLSPDIPRPWLSVPSTPHPLNVSPPGSPGRQQPLSDSAGYQQPRLRINFHTGTLSLALDTLDTMLIRNFYSFFFCLWLLRETVLSLCLWKQNKSPQGRGEVFLFF